MTTPGFGQPGYDPAGQPSDADLGARLTAGGAQRVTDVDVDQLLAGIAALQARVDALEEEKASGSAIPVQATAEALRDLIATHAAHTPGTDHADLLRLADDAVDAAKNAAGSGDGGPLTDIAAKIARALARVNPGPGTHHYYQQAVGFAEVHLPDAAAALVPKSRRPAVASDRAPATVVQGSVTG